MAWALLGLCLLWPAAALSNRSLRIGMFPTSVPPWFQRDTATGKYTTGFLLDFLEELRKTADLDEIVLTPIPEEEFTSDFTGPTQRFLQEDKIDIGWDSNTSLTSNFSYTVSFFENDFSILTKRTTMLTTKWQVFAPFETQLWLCLLLAIFAGAVTISLLTLVHSDQSFSECMRAFPSFFYHTWAALLGGDEYDLYHFPPWGRLYRLGLLFLVMVTSSTYTANLAAFLTRPNFQVHGPRNIEELRTATVCSRWPQYQGTLQLWAGKVISMPQITPGESRYEWAREKLQKDECEAIMDLRAFLKPESLGHCDTMHFHSEISILPLPLYFILRGSDASMARHLSSAILKTMASPAYPAMVARHMQFDASCPNTSLQTELEQIGTEQMSAVFGAFFFCGFMAVALTAVRRLHNKGKSLGEAKHEVQNEKLDGKLDKVLAEIQRMQQSVAAPSRHRSSSKLKL